MLLLSAPALSDRRDERERLRKAGAEVLSDSMVNGESWEDVQWERQVERAESVQRQSRASRRGSIGLPKGLSGLFEQEVMGDSGERQVDPPRIYLKGTREPGIRHSRSLGDDIWESKMGITASAEVMRKDLRESDQFVVLASDGLWEFCSNQEVTDLVMRHTDPQEACKSLLGEAYSRWLQFEVTTDDITVIVAYIDTPEGPAPRPAPQAELDRFEQLALMGERASMQVAQGVSKWMDDEGEGLFTRPVRQGLSKAKKTQLSIALAGGPAAASDAPEGSAALGQAEVEQFPKSDAQVLQIETAVNTSFLFQRIAPEKQRQVFNAMRRRECVEGETIFEQGEQGDTFYVLESGEYVAEMQRPGEAEPTELFTYEQIYPNGADPCFGELALMYSAKRPVTVRCVEPGALWELDRSSFRSVMLQASKENVTRTLRSVEIFRALSIEAMEELVAVLSERTFKPGEKVIRQGEIGTTFYVIAEGRARITRETPFNEEQVLVELGAGEYFGERALLEHEPRAATVVAWGDKPLKLLYISKDAFEEVLGPLQAAMNDYSSWRYRTAASKEFLKNAAGLGKVGVDDFILEGVSIKAEPFTYVLGILGSRQFTIRAASKKKLVEHGIAERIRQEMALLDTVTEHKRFVPLPLTTLEDEHYLYAVMPSRVSITLAELLELRKQPLAEPEALFYGGCAALAVHHLHSEHMMYSGGILYRNLTPEGMVLDEYGYLQLADFRYATKATPTPRDYCGFAHYLSPEQVTGQGHGIAVDYWGLGTLLYEMTTGSNPWIFGEEEYDIGVVYRRIAQHMPEGLQLPEDVTLSAFFVKLLNELFDPIAETRLGAREPGGFDELKRHPAFEKVDWRQLAEGGVAAPHRMICSERVEKVVAATQKERPDGGGYRREELLPSGASRGSIFGLPRLSVEAAMPESTRKMVAAPLQSDRPVDASQVEERLDAIIAGSYRPPNSSATILTNGGQPPAGASAGGGQTDGSDSQRGGLGGFIDGVVQISRRLSIGSAPPMMTTTTGGEGSAAATPGGARHRAGGTPRVEEVGISAAGKKQSGARNSSLGIISEDAAAPATLPGARGGPAAGGRGLPGSPDYYKVGQTPEMQMSVGLNARRPLTEEEEDALEADQLKSTLHRGAGGAKMMSWNNDSPYTQNL